VNAIVVKLSIAAASAITVVPSLVRNDAPSTTAEPVSTPVKVVYVLSTTTTEPPTVWISYDEDRPLSSDDVLLIQQALVENGYEVSRDGLYGPMTEQAVRDFQLANRLLVDGIVGPVTAHALGLDGIIGHTSDQPPAPPTTWIGTMP
jgi:peptidoglycan hydrolase-like protein with peptidoglycan-binding domain